MKLKIVNKPTTKDFGIELQPGRVNGINIFHSRSFIALQLHAARAYKVIINELLTMIKIMIALW